MENMLAHSDQSFSIKAMLDKINRRIWVFDYNFKDSLSFGNFLQQQASISRAQKIIIPARAEDINPLLNLGFITEGIADGFFNGKTAYFMATYPDPHRRVSTNFTAEIRQLNKIITMPRKSPDKLPSSYNMVTATPEDAPALAKFFKRIFSTYPTPLDKACYIVKLIENGAIFLLATRHGQICSCASAEMDFMHGNAEITNCATAPEYQSLGLMSILMHHLEQLITGMDIKCLYSLSRSSEFGINLILHRLGYFYRGTLVNNCHICGHWEDMHLWVKPA